MAAVAFQWRPFPAVSRCWVGLLLLLLLFLELATGEAQPTLPGATDGSDPSGHVEPERRLPPRPPRSAGVERTNAASTGEAGSAAAKPNTGRRPRQKARDGDGFRIHDETTFKDIKEEMLCRTCFEAAHLLLEFAVPLDARNGVAASPSKETEQLLHELVTSDRKQRIRETRRESVRDPERVEADEAATPRRAAGQPTPLAPLAVLQSIIQGHYDSSRTSSDSGGGRRAAAAGLQHKASGERLREVVAVHDAVDGLCAALEFSMQQERERAVTSSGGQHSVVPRRVLDGVVSLCPEVLEQLSDAFVNVSLNLSRAAKSGRLETRPSVAPSADRVQAPRAKDICEARGLCHPALHHHITQERELQNRMDFFKSRTRRPPADPLHGLQIVGIVFQEVFTVGFEMAAAQLARVASVLTNGSTAAAPASRRPGLLDRIHRRLHPGASPRRDAATDDLGGGGVESGEARPRWGDHHSATSLATTWAAWKPVVPAVATMTTVVAAVALFWCATRVH